MPQYIIDSLMFIGRIISPVLGELLKRWTVRRLDSQKTETPPALPPAP